ncbi:MAG: hypothetical protein AB7Q29_10510 [Vicinamibacterales bacterium]
MSRIKHAVLLTAALAASACGGTSTATTPTPTPVTYVDAFNGTLNPNGAASYPFTVSAAGLVYATLTTVSDSSLEIGLSLGTWNGTSCNVVLANDQATQGVTVTGSASGIGILCVRVYDVGKVVTPPTYMVTVIHP